MILKQKEIIAINDCFLAAIRKEKINYTLGERNTIQTEISSLTFSIFAFTRWKMLMANTFTTALMNMRDEIINLT